MILPKFWSKVNEHKYKALIDRTSLFAIVRLNKPHDRSEISKMQTKTDSVSEIIPYMSSVTA